VEQLPVVVEPVAQPYLGRDPITYPEPFPDPFDNPHVKELALRYTDGRDVDVFYIEPLTAWGRAQWPRRKLDAEVR